MPESTLQNNSASVSVMFIQNDTNITSNLLQKLWRFNFIII